MSNPVDLFKLEKLKITAYPDQDRVETVIGSMEVMFNPESYSRKHSLQYQKNPVASPPLPGEGKYSYATPDEFSLKIVLDGTGVTQLGVMSAALAGDSVSKKIDDFKKLCMEINGKIHAPNFLKISWGHLNFNCRLKSVNINYTLFDRGGMPLRAELQTEFVSDATLKKSVLKAGLSSPDVTHRRMVREGDTLPLLSREIYGSPEHYVMLAERNGLDSVRQLKPGQEISFPPLEEQ